MDVIIHTSDGIQRAAADKMQQAVETARNEKDQQMYWQGLAMKSMKSKRFGRKYDKQEEADK